MVRVGDGQQFLE